MRKVLVSAYACEPGKGSEQGVGWNWVEQIAQFCDVVVITRSNNREVIEAALSDSFGAQSVVFCYYDPPAFFQWFKRGERGLYAFYLFWQIGAYFQALSLQRSHKFDAVIALTFGSIWMPTFMHFLPVPFLWGPIGGGEAVPKNLLGALSRRAQVIQRLRYLLFGLLRFNPMLQWCLHRSSVILVRTEDTARLVPKRYSHKTVTVLETAVSQDVIERFAEPRTLRKTEPFRVIYTGRLIGLKNVGSAVHSAAYCISENIDVVLDIYGDGPERSTLEKLCEDLKIGDRVTFHGKVPRETVISALKEADLYLFPSLKEGGVWSLLEAMAASLPVICVNTSGMAIITDAACAIRIPPVALAALRKQMGKALAELATDPERCLRMGQAGRQRVINAFQWEAKGQILEQLFEQMDQNEPMSLVDQSR